MGTRMHRAALTRASTYKGTPPIVAPAADDATLMSDDAEPKRGLGLEGLALPP